MFEISREDWLDCRLNFQFSIHKNCDLRYRGKYYYVYPREMEQEIEKNEKIGENDQRIQEGNDIIWHDLIPLH